MTDITNSDTPSADRHKFFPTQRSPPEKVLMGYWCQNTQTGAVCGGHIGELKPEGGVIETQDTDIETLISSGINLITMFCNIWQPKSMPWKDPGTMSGDEGRPSGDWVTSWGTETKPPLKPEYVKKLQTAGVSVLLTIGSWDAVFPREKTDGYLSNKPVPTSKGWDAQLFVENLKKMSESVGGVDGFDFDIEGFGAGPNPSKEGIWIPYCNKHPNGGPFPKSIDDTSDVSVDERNAFTSGDSGSNGLDDPLGCYSFPDQGTIDVLNNVFKLLKTHNPPFIVTLVPMSAALYSPDKTVEHNQFIKYDIDFRQVDGVILQWYSGAGLNICKDATDTMCNNDIANQCDGNDQQTTLANRHNQLHIAINSNTDIYSKNLNTDDSIIPDVPIHVDPTKLEGNTCPFKCPRKIDCPDWKYEGEDPYESQCKLLKALHNVTNLDISKKIVIGLEGFPNFPGEVSMGKGQMSIDSQFWGPLPSAKAIIGLDAAMKTSRGGPIIEGGIAGVGIYTANTAFVHSSIQYGAKKSIYNLLTTSGWRDQKTGAPTPAAPTPVPAAPTPAPSAPTPVPAAPTPVPSAPTPSGPDVTIKNITIIGSTIIINKAPTPAPAVPTPAPAVPTPAPAAPTPVPAVPTPSSGSIVPVPEHMLAFYYGAFTASDDPTCSDPLNIPDEMLNAGNAIFIAFIDSDNWEEGKLGKQGENGDKTYNLSEISAAIKSKNPSLYVAYSIGGAVGSLFPNLQNYLNTTSADDVSNTILGWKNVDGIDWDLEPPSGGIARNYGKDPKLLQKIVDISKKVKAGGKHVTMAGFGSWYWDTYYGMKELIVGLLNSGALSKFSSMVYPPTQGTVSEAVAYFSNNWTKGGVDIKQLAGGISGLGATPEVALSIAKTYKKAGVTSIIVWYVAPNKCPSAPGWKVADSTTLTQWSNVLDILKS